MNPKKPTLSEDDKALFRAHVGEVEPLVFSPVAITLQKSKRTRDYCLQKRQYAAHGNGLFSDPDLKMPAYDHQEPVTSEERLYFTSGGLQKNKERQFKRGIFQREAKLDLHGLTAPEAYEALVLFLKNCTQGDLRHILLIHGKGHTENPCIKNKVNNWLRNHPQILAFSSATKTDGGAGALYVWLKAKG